MAPFCAAVRGRMVEPVTTRRLVMMVSKSSDSALEPPMKAISTNRPSIARQRRLRWA